MITATIMGQGSAEQGIIVLPPKTFKTGSQGYFGVGKIVMQGRRYQCQVQMVEIGSKPQA